MAEKYWQKEIETASREEIKAIQDERLKKTVAHVFKNVEPYRKRMEEAGLTPDDIKGIVLAREYLFAALDKPFYGDGRGCGC